MKRPELCPRCKINYLEPVKEMNSLSRRDNETYICNGCGDDEAMIDYFHGEDDLSWLEDINA